VAIKNTRGPEVPDDVPDGEDVSGVAPDESGFDLTEHILGLREAPEDADERVPRARRIRSRNKPVEEVAEPVAEVDEQAVEPEEVVAEPEPKPAPKAGKKAKAKAAVTEAEPVVDEAAKADAALKAAVAKADAGFKKASSKASAKVEEAKAEEPAEVEPYVEEAEEEVLPVKKPRVRPVKVKKADAKEEAEETPEDAEELEEEEQPVRQPTRKLTQAPVKKDRPTRKRDEAVTTTSARTTPFMFIRQAIAELKKVVWPAGDVVGQYFIVVLVFVLVVMGIVFGLDQLFGWGLLKLFG